MVVVAVVACAGYSTIQGAYMKLRGLSLGSAPLLAGPRLLFVSCPILHLALLSENNELGTDISIRILMCPKADTGATSVLLADR